MIDGGPAVGLADVIALAPELGQAHFFGLELPTGDIVDGEAEEVDDRPETLPAIG
jgi:hypothetical protein